MISHTSLGTNNLERAESFYLGILALMGGVQIFKSDNVMFWEFEGGGAKLSITLPFDKEPATCGNGSMVAFNLVSHNKVDEVYSMAIGAGGICEGEPGERNNGAYYAAYFRDLDGNKIAIFHR